MFKLGLVINPHAGIGGPLGLKGSDGSAIVDAAMAAGAQLRSAQRMVEALKSVQTLADQITLYCPTGPMGADVVKDMGFDVRLIAGTDNTMTSAEDTVIAAKALQQQGVDLLLFAGGDGTARDIYRALGDSLPVLGVPAGVKMHSGVYAISPQAAGDVLHRMITGQLVDVGLAEIRDIDEQAFREGVVKTRFYGELLVPREGRFLQQVKASGREVEAMVLQDIAADIVESISDQCLYLIGPGTTPRSIMEELGLANTLLGVDAILAGQLLGSDLNEQQLLAMVAEHKGGVKKDEVKKGEVKIILTAIGGQGHILGRGNQQFSPAIIRAVGLENIIVVATKTKISELNGRPLLVDTNDPQLDEALTGYRQVITGYHDAILYPVGFRAKAVS